MSAKYKSPSFLLPNEINTNTNPLNTDGNPATGTGINSLYSMSFPGNSGSATLGGLTSTIIQGDLLTISCWYYPTNVGSSDYIIGSGSTTYGPFTVERNTSNVRIRWKKSSGTNPVNITTTDSPLQANVWHHICGVFDTTNSTATDKIQIWINGVRNTTGDTSLTGSGFGSSGASTDTFINKFRTSPSSPSVKTNSVDELAFFNKALTSTEIAALYDGTGSNIRPSNLMATNLNPIAYYPLGEQAQNTGYLDPNNPGSDISGSEWQFPNGVLQDYVMDFDGNSKINCGPAKAYNIVTLSAWVKPDSPPNYAGIFGTRNLSGVVLPYHLGIVSNTFRFIVTDSTGLKEITANTSFSNNVWYHVMGVADGSTTKLYINGVLQTTTGSYNGTISTPDDDLMIGAQTSIDTSYEWGGEISNVAIWNTDQSANKDKIYNNGSPQTTYTVTPQNWWKLNATSVYTPSAPNYTTSLNLPQPLSASNYIDFPTGGSGWSFNDGAGNDTPFTVSAWVYNTSSTSKYRLLSKNTVGTGAGGYEYAISAGGRNLLGDIEIFLYDSTSGGGTPYIGAKATLHKPNEWVHVAFTYDASAAATGLKIYANGEQLADTDVTAGTYTSMSAKNSKPNIGRTVGSVGCEGNVSNLTVFNSELTASQISTLFNFGTPETTPSFSPTLWFKLDNTTTGIQSAGSLTGASYNGTIGGSVTATSPAGVAVIPSWKIPSALPITTTPNYTTAVDFAGSGNYINTNFNPATAIGNNNSWTMSVWLNSSDFQTIVKFFGAFTGTRFWLGARYGNVQYGFGPSNVSMPNADLPENEWCHVALVYEHAQSEVRCYVNSLLKETDSWTYSASPASSFWIGDVAADSRNYNGKMSNLAIYNTALSAPNISTLYNGGTPQVTVFGSPVSWWKLNNATTITDSSGSGYTGTIVGSISESTTDVITPQPVNGVSTTLPSTALQQSDLQFDSPYSNYSLSFDGNSYIDTNFTLPASYSSFSYSFWFKRTTSANPGTEYIISNLVAPGNNNQARGLIRFGGTNLRIQGGDGTSPDYDTGNISATAILDQNWHHVSVTFVSGEIKTYFDGSLVNTYTNAAIVTGYAADRTYVIGQNGIGSGYLVNSMLDELAIFNKKLTEAEILSIYNNGKPGDISTLSPTNWWRLGENAYFVNNDITLPNSISGAPNGVSSGTATSMLSADAPGTYANGVGTNLDIVDRVGDAALSVANSQSYNMIPSDISPYVPEYVGDQISNTSEMTFDGVDDYFSLGNVSSLNFERTDTFSISAWVKRVGSGTTQFIFSKATNSSPYTGYSIYINPSNQIASNINISYASNHLSVNGNSTLNTSWNHVCVTYDGSSNASGIKLYVNGSKETTSSTGQASITGTLSNSYPVNIAARNSSDLFFNGQIDEVAIFNTALNAGQIYNDIYQPTKTGTNQTADLDTNPNLPTPVAWYRMGD